jgi:DNA-binding NtrC family response regulator/pSer/pThr/pTyr-binding forkhead associated (FHA) protein
VATPSTLVDDRTAGSATSGDGGPAGLHLLVMGPRQFATHALPSPGAVTVGRAGDASVDVKLEDAKASRRHLRLHVGAAGEIDVEDLGSANGTRVHERKLEPGARVRVFPGEPIAVGSLVLMVQPDRPARRAGRGRMLSHAEFESRVEWECARAEATGGTFSVARVRARDGAAAPAPRPAGPPLPARPIDVVGLFGPGEWELLLPGLAGETARVLAGAFADALGGAPRVGVACYPADGRHAAALLARAGARTAGDGAANEGGAGAGDEGLTGFVCADEAMRRVLALAERAAAGDINVLILGETGVGKEVLARAIHAASPRAGKPMVSINCAALSLALLESELFGHERGAFTGAAQAKPGLLETAPGGTVFLDELGELPPPLQAKLLRVIETREVLRVGGVRARRIDVRFVSATNRDLEAEVSRGGFRRDLYFRLNGMTLTIPPLRERPRDLPVLARGFLAASARGFLAASARGFLAASARGFLAASAHGLLEPAARAGGPRPAAPRRVPEISEAAMAALRAHSWPGNVRELRNAIERALLLCDGPALLPEHLPQPVPFVADPPPPAPASPGGPTAPGAPANDERARILAALAACGGNQSRAARQLGISRKVLIARLDRYGVARPRRPGR